MTPHDPPQASARALETARALAEALDRSDEAAARPLLAPGCVYDLGGRRLVGPDAILASYRASAEWATAHFDQVRYESRVRPETAGRVAVTYVDHLARGGRSLTYTCEQWLTVDADGRVARIEHRDLPGEPEALRAYFDAVGLGDVPRPGAEPAAAAGRAAERVAERVLAVIPARFGATRFPGKPLATLWGRPLLEHVWNRARAVGGVDRLVIATDDDRIERVARAFGGEVVRTSPACASGTDRVAEVARAHAGHAIVVNLQGDEPELDPEAVSRLVAGMRADPAIRMATLAHREDDPAVLARPDVVKVAVDDDGCAVYFSRVHAVPGPGERAPLRHVGVYGFRRDLLLEFAAWPPGEAERAERLEQLRALERGVRIRVFETARGFSGVDTPEQLAELERRGPPRG